VNDTKDRIVVATAELFRRNGYTGTGLKQISAESSAPLGSVYHFFPGGKEQLAAETLRYSGHGYQVLFESFVDNEDDVLVALDNFFNGAGEVLRLTDYADACPIATVALEVASTNDALRQVTAEIFESWLDSSTTRLMSAGVGRKRARELSVFALAALEGAFLLCRASKTTEAMDVARRNVKTAVRAALPAGHRRRRRRARQAGG
jgi:AcrR family transcriptional regulator